MTNGKTQGFTLVEMMVVVAVIGVVATIAMPSLLRSRIAANEASAVGTLRTIMTAQSTWRAGDTDRNMISDYWTADVSGLYRTERAPAGSGIGIAAVDEAVAMADDAKFSQWGMAGGPIPGTTVSAAGLIPMTRRQSRAGYFFRAMQFAGPLFTSRYRQDPDGNFQFLTNSGQFGFQARPETYNSTGLNTFIVNERGVIFGRDFGNANWWNARNWPGSNPTALGWRVVQ